MRILFVNHFFHPEPNFFLGLPFARELVKLGHEVEVLTGFPHYPGGKVYDGYRVRPLQRDTIEGIPVIRVPVYPSHDRSGVRRVTSYMSFALSASTIGSAMIKPADVSYVYQGPATLGLPAGIHRLLRGIPFVFNIQDLWPDTLASTGMFDNRIGLKLVDAWCKCVYRGASKIVVISPGVKRKLCERGVPQDKVEVIYNWCDESQVRPVEPDPALARDLGLAGRFNVLFAGNIGVGQSLGAVLAAASIVGAEHPEVQFVFIGGGVEVGSLKQKAEDMKLSNVRFLERRPPSEISPILRLADVLLVHLKDHPLFRITIPSKIQAYMAVGRPILIGVKGEKYPCKPEIFEATYEPVGDGDGETVPLRMSIDQWADLLAAGKAAVGSAADDHAARAAIRIADGQLRQIVAEIADARARLNGPE